MTGGTISNWEILITVFGIVAPLVIGAWTAWNRHLTYKQYLIAFVAIWAAVIITQALHRQGGWIAVSELATQPLVLFAGVHFMVRRLHTVGWRRYLGIVPLVNGVASVVLLFKRDPRPIPESPRTGSKPIGRAIPDSPTREGQEKSPVVSDRRKFISGLFRGWLWCSIAWIVLCLVGWLYVTHPAIAARGFWRTFWSFFIEHDGWLLMVVWPLGLGILVAVVFGIYFAFSKPT